VKLLEIYSHIGLKWDEAKNNTQANKEEEEEIGEEGKRGHYGYFIRSIYHKKLFCQTDHQNSFSFTSRVVVEF